MRNLLLLFCLSLQLQGAAQQKWFTLYQDSASMITDANSVVADFIQRVNAVSPVMTASPSAILNTKPYLIFYTSKTNAVNLPIWHQVMAPQKEFFYQLSGSKEEGETVFGLFFNGFYLPHELGHALQSATKKRDSSLYANEYFANEVAMLYWREVSSTKELEQCYAYAKKFVSQLKNPVPEGEDPIDYFNSHYNELGADPFKYAYFQFRQFIQVYEDKTLGDFNSFIKKFLSNL